MVAYVQVIAFFLGGFCGWFAHKYWNKGRGLFKSREN